MFVGVLGSVVRRAIAGRVQSAHYSTTGSKHVVVVGGGAGGLAVGAGLANKGAVVTVIEPAEYHYYQPLFTLVGGGVKPLAESRKPTKDVMPRNLRYVSESAQSFSPESNSVTLSNSETIQYDALVVATGIVPNYSAVEGLEDALANDKRVSTIYSPQHVERVWESGKALKSGNAVFSFPTGPIKCAGAPQKIMYLLEDHWNREGRRGDISVDYYTSLPQMFGVKKYSDALHALCERRNISTHFTSTLSKVDAMASSATFSNAEGGESVVKFDFLHVSPPHKPLAVVAESELANEGGFVAVDDKTLQHVKYPNVFSLGDASSCPTSKTAAAAASQSAVVKKNVTAFLRGESLTAEYNGYTTCPLVTGKDKLILAEFLYGGVPHETFHFNQAEESKLMYLMKVNVLPPLYWSQMLKGNWEGPAHLRKVFNPLGRD